MGSLAPELSHRVRQGRVLGVRRPIVSIAFGVSFLIRKKKDDRVPESRLNLGVGLSPSLPKRHPNLLSEDLLSPFLPDTQFNIGERELKHQQMI